LIISLALFIISGGDVQRGENILNTDGIKINAYFSQTSGSYYDGGGIDDLLIESILKAKQNDRIRDVLKSAHQSGVEVKIVTDDQKLFIPDMKELQL